MATFISPGVFLPALRRILLDLPLARDDRNVLLEAVEDCQLRCHNEREAAAMRVKRSKLTPAQKAARIQYQREYRARKKAAAQS